MEELKLDFIQLNKALATVDKALAHQSKPYVINDEDSLLAAQDSTIQRFEYTYESFWKFLKKYIEQVHNKQ